MDRSVQQEINRFFNIYRGRIEDIIAPLPNSAKEELENELDLLRVSIENRLTELDV